MGYRDILSPKVIAQNQRNMQISWPRDRVIWKGNHTTGSTNRTVFFFAAHAQKNTCGLYQIWPHPVTLRNAYD
jgi:hypothetical protein